MNKAVRKNSYNPEETRRRLLDAGLDLFGRSGFDAVSTRQLAEAAGVSLNAIQYHFGGKEEVYLAVAGHIVETTGLAMRRAAQAITIDAEKVTAIEAARRVGELLSSVVTIFLGTADASTRGMFMLREQMNPGRAFDLMYEGYVDAVHSAITALCAQARGLAPDDPDAIIQAHAMFGQALAFGVARNTLARRLGRKQLSADDLPAIARIVERSAVCALVGSAVEG